MKLQRKALVVAISTAFCYPATGLADESDSVLKSVVVSATKIEQSTLEAPANVSVITAEQLEKRNTFVVGDALTAKVPSLYLRGGAVDGGRAGSTMQPSFRGMGINRNLLLIDGQSLTDAYSGQMNWSSISMNDVEQIEVIPGVGSALYGSAALGGVISVITKAPTKFEMTGKITQGFSDGERTKVEAGYRDKFENGLGVVMNFSQDDRAGYAADLVTLANPAGTPLAGAKVVTGIQPTTTPQGAPTNIIGDKGFNASRATNANFKLFYDLSSTTKLHAGVAYTESKFQTEPYHVYLADMATGQPLALPTSNLTATNLSINGKKSSLKESAFFGTNPGGRSLMRYFAGLETEIYSDYKLKLNFGRIDSNGWSVGAGSTTTNTMSTGAGTLSDGPNTTLNGSAELSFGVGDNQFIVTGLAIEQGTLNLKKYALSNWTNTDSKTRVNTSVDATSSTTSLFAQDQISIGDRLTVYAGGRYDAWSSHGNSQDFLVPANNLNSPERTATSFNPKLSAVYKLNEWWALKGSAGTGFRAPNNYELYANPTFSGAASPNGKLILANPNLKPETAQSWDLGTQMDFKQGGNFKFAYYETMMKDMIYQTVTKVPTYTLAGTTNVIDFWGQQNNVAGAKIHGVELSGELPVTRWLSINASYTYTGAVITSDGGLNTGMVGKRISNVPKNMASFGLDARQGDWQGVISTRYIGEVYGSSDNLNTDVVKDVWTGYSKYWLTDMKIGYQINKTFLTNIAVSNLLDKKYYAYYPMPGRSVNIDVSIKF
ncbi:TonB-dependent receptor [Propionivibrio sp.]|uniref:TonB-dependent receptor n=1 Tax=Propionivibrio sp. TaxID=2212460 RepID=UPI003BF45B1C